MVELVSRARPDAIGSSEIIDDSIAEVDRILTRIEDRLEGQPEIESMFFLPSMKA